MLSCMFSSISLTSRNLRKRKPPTNDYTLCSQASLMSFELHLMLSWMLFNSSCSISKLSSISWSRNDLNWKLEKTENLCRETSQLQQLQAKSVSPFYYSLADSLTVDILDFAWSKQTCLNSTRNHSRSEFLSTKSILLLSINEYKKEFDWELSEKKDSEEWYSTLCRQQFSRTWSRTRTSSQILEESQSLSNKSIVIDWITQDSWRSKWSTAELKFLRMARKDCFKYLGWSTNIQASSAWKE